MKVLGSQLDSSSYESFKLEMASQLPHLCGKVQTVNAAGRFAVNGAISDADLAQIHAIYDCSNEAPVYDIFAAQRRERGRKQTWHARAKRTANGLRFHK